MQIGRLTFPAYAQSSYCDDLGRCFSSNTNDAGITFGVAIPEVAAAPFPVILQVTAPVEMGWVGFSWGGGMTYNPLTIAWPNGEDLVASARAAL